MQNYIQNGHIVRVTTPAGGIASGDPLIVGSIFGVAAYSSAEGDPVELSTTGVFQLPKSSAAVLIVGGAGRETVTLAPQGENSLKGDAKNPIAAGATITLTIKTAEGKSGQAKFKK